ncbi:MAG: hypothetical protein IT258_10865 [Saprospiraceae bacterium]|nr:hypothetical protein [Saprospiraceae bacterium]
MNTYEITPKDILLRRIPLKPSHIFQGRITSACFKTKPNENGLSVDIEALVIDIPSSYNMDTHTLARVSASVPIELGYVCKYDPVEGNNAHALITGDTCPIAKKLALAAQVIDTSILDKF